MFVRSGRSLDFSLEKIPEIRCFGGATYDECLVGCPGTRGDLELMEETSVDERVTFPVVPAEMHIHNLFQPV